MKKRDPNGFQILGLTFYRHSGRDLLTIDTVAGTPGFFWLFKISVFNILKLYWNGCFESKNTRISCDGYVSDPIWNIYEADWSHCDLTLTSHWCCGEGGSCPAVFKVSTRYIVVFYSQFYCLSYILPPYCNPPPILCVYNVHVIRTVGVCTIIYTLLIQRLS